MNIGMAIYTDDRCQDTHFNLLLAKLSVNCRLKWRNTYALHHLSKALYVFIGGDTLILIHLSNDVNGIRHLICRHRTPKNLTKFGIL